MTLKEQLNQQLSHIQQRTKGDKAGVVTMSAQDCDALFDMAMKLLDCVEALEDTFTLMDEGKLVRDTSKDHEASWPISQIDFVQRLAKSMKALTALRLEVERKK